MVCRDFHNKNYSNNSKETANNNNFSRADSGTPKCFKIKFCPMNMGHYYY